MDIKKAKLYGKDVRCLRKGKSVRWLPVHIAINPVRQKTGEFEIADPAFNNYMDGFKEPKEMAEKPKELAKSDDELIKEKPIKTEEEKPRELEDLNKKELQVLYKEKFGKAPHGRTRIETLIEKIKNGK
jgi:hypothetical protein